MRPYAKMAMIRAAQNNGGEMRYEMGEARYEGGDQSGPEMRRYRNGRFAPRSEGEMRYESGEGRYEGGDRSEPEMRRYRNGRFAPRNEGGMRYEMDEEPSDYRRSTNRIGFAAKGNVMDFPSGKMGKPSKPGSSHRFTREMAEEWTEGMKNKDKSKGPHWDLEKAAHAMKTHNLRYDEYEFWAVLNAVYSDYCEVLEKHGVSNMEVYIDLAKAWLDDEDAVEGKAAAYFECVVK